MLLCLDVGNTHVLGGVFADDKLCMRFRYATHLIGTADQFGIFLLNILKAHDIPVEEISGTAVSSVVPGYDFTIKHTISLYLKSTYFTLTAQGKLPIHIQYENPNEVGADRIANAIGAINAYPQQNIIIIDMGTATTVCAVTADRQYLGGAILPGLRLGMEALKNQTAKLMAVEIEVPTFHLGKTTRASLQSGLYYGQLGALKEIVAGIKRENFNDEKTLIIGTGGFSQLYKDKALFDVILPDLVLQGLAQAYADAK